MFKFPIYYLEKPPLSCVVFDNDGMLFEFVIPFLTFLEQNNVVGTGRGWCNKMFVVLASEPVGGRSQATELVCFIY